VTPCTVNSQLEAVRQPVRRASDRPTRDARWCISGRHQHRELGGHPGRARAGVIESGRDSVTDQFGLALYTVAHAIAGFHRGELERLGLTYPQYLVMVELWQHDTLTVGELSRRLQLTTGTLSPLLKRLETANFLARRRSPDDERVVRVHATKAGRGLLDHTEQLRAQLHTTLGIPAEEITALTDQLKKLTARIRPERQITDPSSGLT
jgi:DNA-binding MarR family transcriptional regulator